MTPGSQELRPQDLRVDLSTLTPDSLESARRLFDRWGCFVATGLVDISALQQCQSDIRRLIALRAGASPIPAAEEEDFDAGFLALNRVNRSHGGVIYNACRRLLPVHELSASRRLAQISQALMKTQTVISSNLKAVRIDHPSEDKYLFDWHQDYPYIQDSEDSVVYWIPLHDVDERHGCLIVAPGSHKGGLRRVKIVDPHNRNQSGAKTIALENPSEPENFETLSLPIRFGEVLVLSTLLLHRSQPNRSRRARWTIQIRHGNFENEKAITRDWPGGMIEGVGFWEHHPEYVANPEDLP